MASARRAADSPRQGLAAAVAVVAVDRHGNDPHPRAGGNRDTAGRRSAAVLSDILTYRGAANGDTAGQVRFARRFSTSEAARTTSYREGQ